MDIFSCQTVIEAINLYLRGTKEKIPHGARAQLAKAIGCHPSYLAQVQSGIASFSQEQALEFSSWAKLSEDQTEFFLAMVNIERAGSKELQDFYIRKKQQVLGRQGVVGRMLTSDRLTEEQEGSFFSRWDCQAVHSALQIPKLHSARTIADFLFLPMIQVEEILRTLKNLGLVEQSKNQWVSLRPFVHFHGGNPLIRQQFHLGWRLKAIERNFVGQPKGSGNQLNFSSLIALNANLHEQVRERLKAVIFELSNELKDAPADRLTVLNIDLFSLQNHP